MVVEGHADERGTREYNLALGARRAEAARSYLISQGVSASRITTISFGKERPESLCSAETCWLKKPQHSRKSALCALAFKKHRTAVPPGKSLTGSFSGSKST